MVRKVEPLGIADITSGLFFQKLGDYARYIEEGFDMLETITCNGDWPNLSLEWTFAPDDSIYFIMQMK